MGASYIRAADLPQVIPVFPLDGVLLLPRGSLPLNIFEPRYLNMIDDAMAGDRIIGMVQLGAGGDPTRPGLAKVGCAGRITSYAETSDGRYIITLTGICRFRLGAELPVQSPYRQVRADFSTFEDDLKPGGGILPRPGRPALGPEGLSGAQRPGHRLADGRRGPPGVPGQQPRHGPALRGGGETGAAGGRDPRPAPLGPDGPDAHRRRPGRRRAARDPVRP